MKENKNENVDPSALVGMLILTVSIPRVRAEQTQKVNLNVATSSELESLPGIRPSTVERILEFREKKGPFKRIEDLMNVCGISEIKFSETQRLCYG